MLQHSEKILIPFIKSGFGIYGDFALQYHVRDAIGRAAQLIELLQTENKLERHQGDIKMTTNVFEIATKRAGSVS